MGWEGYHTTAVRTHNTHSLCGWAHYCFFFLISSKPKIFQNNQATLMVANSFYLPETQLQWVVVVVVPNITLPTIASRFKVSADLFCFCFFVGGNVLREVDMAQLVSLAANLSQWPTVVLYQKLLCGPKNTYIICKTVDRKPFTFSFFTFYISKLSWSLENNMWHPPSMLMGRAGLSRCSNRERNTNAHVRLAAPRRCKPGSKKTLFARVLSEQLSFRLTGAILESGTQLL